MRHGRLSSGQKRRQGRCGLPADEFHIGGDSEVVDEAPPFGRHDDTEPGSLALWSRFDDLVDGFEHRQRCTSRSRSVPGRAPAEGDPAREIVGRRPEGQVHTEKRPGCDDQVTQVVEPRQRFEWWRMLSHDRSSSDALRSSAAHTSPTVS